MTSIFSQKNYVYGKEFIYDCSIDDNDLIHFVYGTSNGMSSNSEIPKIDTVYEKFIIDFPKFKIFIKELNENKIEKSYFQKFLRESFDILDKLWVDD